MDNINILNELKKNILKIGIMEVVLGLVLFLLPSLLPGMIMIAMGIIFVLIGVINIILIRKQPEAKIYSYFLPVVLIVLGGYTIINPSNVVTIIAWIIGAGTIVKGVFMIMSKDMPTNSQGYKIAGIASIIMGIIIILLASSAGTLFSYYMGAIVVFHGGVDLWRAYELSRATK